MSKTKLVIPESENGFLNTILIGVKKRSKSLKYNSWEFTIERVFEEYEDSRTEKIEVKVKPSSPNAWIELCIWEDRWITVSCWERTKDSKWDWFYEGKFLPEYEGKPFIQAIEVTNSCFFEMNKSKTTLFTEIWSPMLAQGPRLVI